MQHMKLVQYLEKVEDNLILDQSDWKLILVYVDFFFSGADQKQLFIIARY